MISSPNNKMQKRAVVKRIQRKHRHRWGAHTYVGNGLNEQLCLFVGCTGFRVTDTEGRLIEQGE